MTFPAGGGNTPAGGGPTGPAAIPPDAPKPPSTDAASGAADAKPTEQQPDAGTSAAAAPPTPKVERPASFREALDRARTAPASEDGAPEPKAEAPKQPEPKKEAADAPPTEEPKTVPDKPEPKKETAPPPKVEKPAAAAAPAPKIETASDADVSDGEDDDALVEAASKDDRAAFEEAFPEADKGKKGPLDFAFRTARKNAELRPIAELVESVGGMDGAKLAFDYTKALTQLARPTATAEEAFEQAEGFREFLFKNAPGAYAKLENGIFWNAVDDTPEGRANIQALLDERYGEGVVTTEVSDILHNAFADGQIDVDELRERADYTKTKQQRELEARRSKRESAEVAALREQVAKLQGGQEETAEAKAEARKAKVATAFTSFVQDNFKLIQPILREYGFAYPDDPASPAFKSMARRIRHIQRDLEEVMEKDEDYNAVIGNISNLQTDNGVHAIQRGTAQRKMQVALREILDEVAPEAAAEVKRKNRLVADRVKQNGKTPTTTAPAKPATATPPRDASNSERAIDGEGRRQGMARMIEQGRRDQANA
jgi:hypothetical protein